MRPVRPTGGDLSEVTPIDRAIIHNRPMAG
jgi:hypothetical protein